MKIIFDVARLILDILLIYPSYIIAIIVDLHDDVAVGIISEENEKIIEAVKDDNVRNISTTTRTSTMLKSFTMAH